MSDMDWKEGCRIVAEWLGEYAEYASWADDSRTKHWFGVDYTLDGVDHAHDWPDYTRDEAAAWRLHKAIGNRMFVFASGHGNYSPVNRGQMLKAHAGIFLSVDSWEKAQVLATHELIEAGEKPLEVG